MLDCRINKTTHHPYTHPPTRTRVARVLPAREEELVKWSQTGGEIEVQFDMQERIW
jgi:hypothetical protein